MLCVKTVKLFVEILLPPDNPIILVFHHQGSLLNSNGFIPIGGTEYKRGEKIGQFLISQCIKETVQDTAIVAIEVE